MLVLQNATSLSNYNAGQTGANVVASYDASKNIGTVTLNTAELQFLGIQLLIIWSEKPF